MVLIKKDLLIGAIAGVSMLAVGCGGSGSSTVTSKSAELPLTTATVELKEDESLSLTGGFSLTAVDSYNAEVVGCLSGWSSSGLTQANASINVPDTDSNCEFQLVDAIIDGETFDFSGVSDWSASSAFLVTGSLGTSINFTVAAQLASPISGAQTVSVTYGVFSVGAQADNVQTNVSAAGITVAGSDEIDLEIGNINVTIDAVDGHGNFEIQLDCGSAVAAGSCGTTVLADVKLILLNSAVQADPADIGECQTIGNAGVAGHPAHANGNGGIRGC